MQPQNTHRKCLMTTTTQESCQLMHDGVWTGRLICAGFLPLCATSTYYPEGKCCMWYCCSSSCSACQILAGCQDHHRPLPHFFSTAYSYSMYTNHSLFSTVFDLACQLWHATIGTMSASAQRAILMQQGFFILLVGGWELDKRSSVRLSVAPAVSLYYTDWLMYSDQPESTVLAGKQV